MKGCLSGCGTRVLVHGRSDSCEEEWLTAKSSSMIVQSHGAQPSPPADHTHLRITRNWKVACHAVESALLRAGISSHFGTTPLNSAPITYQPWGNVNGEHSLGNGAGPS